MPETQVIGRRVLAYLADAVFVVGSVLALDRARDFSSERSLGWELVIAGVVAFPYHVLLEGVTGQTVGKRLAGIEVRKDDGEPCTFRAAAIRTALRFVDWHPVFYIIGIVSIGLTERDQRIGDLVAGTVVVATDREGDDSAT